jgi:hypothetical protein
MKQLTEILRASGIAHQLKPVDADPTILTLAVGGKAAIPMWKKLRSLVEKTNHWPVILGADADALDMLDEAPRANPAPVDRILKTAAQVSVEEYLETHGFAETADYAVRTTTQVKRAADYILPFDAVNRRPHPSVLLALVPTKNGAESPAYLRAGNFNGSPPPAVHVAFAAYWNKLYGAEIVGISRDMIEMSVANPPTTPEDALLLARRQSIYCDDIVGSGVGDIGDLAAALLNCPRWCFWWD